MSALGWNGMVVAAVNGNIGMFGQEMKATRTASER